MKIELYRLWLSLKNMRLWFFLPFPVLYLILPSLQNNVLRAELEVVEARLMFFSIAQTIIPIFSILWLFLLYRELMENDIVEVVYANDHIPKLRFAGYLLVLYHITIIPLYVWYAGCYEYSGWEMIRLSFQIFVLYSAFYAVLYLAKSSLSALGSILICNGALLFVFQEKFKLNLYLNRVRAEEMPLGNILLYSGLIVLFIFLGLAGERWFFVRKKD